MYVCMYVYMAAIGKFFVSYVFHISKRKRIIGIKFLKIRFFYKKPCEQLALQRKSVSNNLKFQIFQKCFQYVQLFLPIARLQIS